MRLSNRQCLTPEQFTALADGEETRLTRAALQEHLQRCPRCRQKLEQVEFATWAVRHLRSEEERETPVRTKVRRRWAWGRARFCQKRLNPVWVLTGLIPLLAMGIYLGLMNSQNELPAEAIIDTYARAHLSSSAAIQESRVLLSSYEIGFTGDGLLW